MLRIISIPKSAEINTLSVPSYYRLASAMLLPPPFKITPNRSGVFEHELYAVIEARAAGANDSEVRTLVLKLVDERISNYKNSKTKPQTIKKES